MAVVLPQSNRPKPAILHSLRDISVQVLSEWSQEKHFAEDLLDAACRRHRLSSPDAGLLHAIVLDALRNFTLLDHWLDQLTCGRRLDPRTRWVARVGLVQLLVLELSPHAAVHETVEVAGKAKGLVNAVLRRADRERSELVAQRDLLPLHIRTSHPQWLVRRWLAAFGEEKTAQLCEWNQGEPCTFVRQNPLHLDSSRLLESPDLADIGNGFFLCKTVPREALAAGWCYAQDPSTAIAPRMLDAQPGEIVLDACAAPGGKTSMLAAAMKNTGRLFAADSSAARLDRLRANLQRLRVTNAEVFHHDLASDAPPPWGADVRFDRILLDVPCSNTGVMRRRIDVRWRLRESDFVKLVKTQTSLLSAAIRLLKPDGVVVFSTCSIEHEENRAIVDSVLRCTPNLTLEGERMSFPGEDKGDGACAAKLRRVF